MNDEKEVMPKGDLDAVIKQTMSEAEAAVDGVRDPDPSPSAEGASATEASPADLAARIEELTRDNEGLRDKWLRAVADHENFKKRTKRELEDATQRAVQELLSSFLPVADNLERALEAAGKNEDEFVKGVRMVASEFYAALAKHEIVPVEAVGKPFDPSVHDALQQIDSPDHAPGTVVLEFERGYLRAGRLLRPARVVVAGAGSGTNLATDSADPEDDATNHGT
ncbi:MAG: nucleotide exchange factor GrpE [Myxococcales bacterium FL481]|nr:MAG: nucleotide exchange factor GrpE [Myxococcales bacterium FL481]